MSAELDCIEDFRKKAIEKLTPENNGYFNSGSGAGQTFEDNCQAYRRATIKNKPIKHVLNRWRFRPRLLRDVSNIDLSTTVLGCDIPFPICISPTAVHKKAHPGGEVTTAKAAGSSGVVFVQSTLSNCSMEEVALEVPNCLRWCQIQLFKNRDLIEHIVRRAETSGFSALILTIDQSVLSKRTHGTEDENVNIAFSFKNFYLSSKLWYHESEISKGKHFASLLDSSVTWDYIVWLKGITKLPVVVKGILTAEMALEAVEHGVDGIIVSNHGGRQLDGVFATIDSLPEVVAAVKGRCDVYLDGGIRRGSDIAKAIALGAKAVFIGRPVLWGLACKGESGVRKVLEIFRDELKIIMQLLGVTSLEELQKTPNLVVRENENHLQNKL